MVALEMAGGHEQASEMRSGGETDHQFRTGNRNHETNLWSEFQEPQWLNNELVMVGKWSQLLKQEVCLGD